MIQFYPYDKLDAYLNLHTDNYLLHIVLPLLTKTFKLKKPKTGENKIIMVHNQTNLHLTISIIGPDKLTLMTKEGSLTMTPITKIVNIIEFVNKLNPDI